jgi:hypothetical protein
VKRDPNQIERDFVVCLLLHLRGQGLNSVTEATMQRAMRALLESDAADVTRLFGIAPVADPLFGVYDGVTCGLSEAVLCGLLSVCPTKDEFGVDVASADRLMRRLLSLMPVELDYVRSLFEKFHAHYVRLEKGT